MSEQVIEPWYSHRVLYRALTIDVEYIVKTPLRIGSGRTSKLTSPIDLPVLTVKLDGIDKPYIPGSSIKGVFRSTAEFISRSVRLSVCNAGEGCRASYDKTLQNSLKGKVEEVFNTLDKYCVVCKIFGSGTYRSHINFGDAYPTTEVSTGIKTGIAIDRKSGAARRGALFTIEYVNPGAKFSGRFTLNNLPNYGVGLTSYIIDMINSGIVRFGGMKTRGFGQVGIDIKGIKVYVSENHRMEEVKGKKLLKALDGDDQDVEYDEQRYKEYLDRCKEVWNRYVSRKVH
ncbi:MAG: CRISPR-associated RAMP protein Csx7 [Nitrososphaerota archaeon]